MTESRWFLELLREAVAEREGSARKTVALLVRMALEQLQLAGVSRQSIAESLKISTWQLEYLVAEPERIDPVALLRLSELIAQHADTPERKGLVEILVLFADLASLTQMARGAVHVHLAARIGGTADARRAIVHAEIGPDASRTLAAGVGALKRYLALTFSRQAPERS